MTTEEIINQRIIGADLAFNRIIKAYDRHDKGRTRTETRKARQLAKDEHAKFILECEVHGPNEKHAEAAAWWSTAIVIACVVGMVIWRMAV